MSEQRPENRRRKLSPKEQKALEKQQRMQREQEMKRRKAEAQYREKARKDARRRGEDGHVVVTIPADFDKRKKKPHKKKPKKKTIPDIISAETNKRVREMPPSDHSDGYYVNEVAVRRQQAEKQRDRRKKSQPKQISPKKRRIRRIIATTIICLVVFVVGIVLSFTVLFKTEHIEIKGNKYYDNDTIIQLSGVSEGENIFVASITGNGQAIHDTLPYVKSAGVGFSIPNTVVINIENEIPYYTLKSGRSYFLVSEEGRLLEKVSKRPKKLMLVTAPPLKNTKLGSYVKFKRDKATRAMETIAESLRNNKCSNITAVNVKKLTQISITYDNRIKIILGLPKDIDYKIRTAFTIIDKKLDPNKLGRITGKLNVSECKTTKRSYFNEGNVKVTIPETTAMEESTDESVRTTYVTLPETESVTESYGGDFPLQYPDQTETQAYTQPITEGFE